MKSEMKLSIRPLHERRASVQNIGRLFQITGSRPAERTLQLNATVKTKYGTHEFEVIEENQHDWSWPLGEIVAQIIEDLFHRDLGHLSANNFRDADHVEDTGDRDYKYCYCKEAIICSGKMIIKEYRRTSHLYQLMKLMGYHLQITDGEIENEDEDANNYSVIITAIDPDGWDNEDKDDFLIVPTMKATWDESALEDKIGYMTEFMKGYVDKHALQKPPAADEEDFYRLVHFPITCYNFNTLSGIFRAVELYARCRDYGIEEPTREEPMHDHDGTRLIGRWGSGLSAYCKAAQQIRRILPITPKGADLLLEYKHGFEVCYILDRLTMNQLEHLLEGIEMKKDWTDNTIGELGGKAVEYWNGKTKKLLNRVLAEMTHTAIWEHIKVYKQVDKVEIDTFKHRIAAMN